MSPPAIGPTFNTSSSEDGAEKNRKLTMPVGSSSINHNTDEELLAASCATNTPGAIVVAISSVTKWRPMAVVGAGRPR